MIGDILKEGVRNLGEWRWDMNDGFSIAAGLDLLLIKAGLLKRQRQENWAWSEEACDRNVGIFREMWKLRIIKGVCELHSEVCLSSSDIFIDTHKP